MKVTIKFEMPDGDEDDMLSAAVMEIEDALPEGAVGFEWDTED